MATEIETSRCVTCGRTNVVTEWRRQGEIIGVKIAVTDEMLLLHRNWDDFRLQLAMEIVQGLDRERKRLMANSKAETESSE